MKQGKNILGSVPLLYTPCLNSSTLAAYFYSIDYFSVCHIEYLVVYLVIHTHTHGYILGYIYKERGRERSISPRKPGSTFLNLGYTALSWPKCYLARNKGRQQKTARAIKIQIT